MKKYTKYFARLLHPKRLPRIWFGVQYWKVREKSIMGWRLQTLFFVGYIAIFIFIGVGL